MNIKEYNEIKHYNYDEYCDYLVQKYGAATEPYFTDTYWTKKNKPKQPVANKKATRTKEGLFMHHKQENHVASLSSPMIAAAHDYELQSAENLIPCDYLEHLLLHILICEDPQPFEGEHVGANGTLTWILPALVSFFEKKHIPQEWQVPAFNRIADHRETYDALIDRFIHSELIQENCDVTEEELRNLVSDRLVFSHNDIVIEQINDYLRTDNKALVDLGTGLGKTTTALQYAIDHKCNCLVLCPSDIIKDGWKKSAMTLDKRVGKKLEIMSYQGFANQYENIDWSQYDLLICDEAHHCRGPVWGKGVRYVIENKLLKVIGLTATPADVGDSLFGGNVCKGLTVPEGIEQGIIHPISYVGAYYSTENIMEQVGSFKDQKLIGELNLAINNTPTLKEIILTNMPKGSRKCIIFTQTIEAMDQAIDILKDIYPDGEYRKIHSKMGSDEVEANKKWFEDTNEGFLCAVNMISEGAHYRGVNTVFMFRKTKSELLFNQQIGRIITLSKYNNPHSILFDLVNNANSVEVSKPLKVSIGKRKEMLEREKNSAQQAEQIIIKDYCSDIVEILNRIKYLSLYNKKPIYQFDVYTKKCLRRYDSAQEASLVTGVSFTKISLVVNKKRKTAGGFYWSFSPNNEFEIDLEYIGMGRNKTVHRYNLQGEYIDTWSSATDAELTLNIAKGKVSAACRGNQDTAGGFYWSYEQKKCFSLKVKEGVVKHTVGHNEKCKTYQYDITSGCLLKEFDSVSSAGDEYNGGRVNIGRVCQGRQHSAYGFYWSFIKADNYKDIKPEAFKKKRGGKKRVYQYDQKTGSFLNEYETATEATRAIGLAKGAVSATCRKEQKTASGYCWSYVKADNYFDIKE